MTTSYNSIMKYFSFVKKISDVKMASDQIEYCVESFSQLSRVRGMEK